MRAPVRRASAMSRSTITSSASAGMPGMPRWLDHSPSCMWPPLASAASSQCWASVMSSADAYSRARRMRRASCTPAPSSVNRRTPSAAISASGASCSPARPTVMAPATRTSHTAVAPSSSTSRTTAAQSMARLGVGHGDDGGVAARGPRRARRSRPSPPPRGRAGGDARAGRRGPGATVQPDASSTTARAGASIAVAHGDDPSRRAPARRRAARRWRRRRCRPG